MQALNGDKIITLVGDLSENTIKQLVSALTMDNILVSSVYLSADIPAGDNAALINADNENKTVLARSQGVALTGAPDHLALDSSGKAAVEKGAYTTPASPAHSHARARVRTHSGTVTSEPASLGIQIQFGCLPPPALQSSSPTSLPAPCS